MYQSVPGGVWYIAVRYFYTRIENLAQCTEASTHLITDVINKYNLEPPPHLPDHSILKVNFKVTNYVKNDNDHNSINDTVYQNNGGSKININKINDNFFISPEIHQKF